jgi:hypothetical protein
MAQFALIEDGDRRRRPTSNVLIMDTKGAWRDDVFVERLASGQI